ncbi:Hypothetical predicted protein [Podarcis lilfordi]|uniref:Uncharacterized protein n=1 Tax=Podarcis lilfordi TaxID=74358 RepID=A0AA35P1B2_9SAUR|nr:Hypothetical predicted protein [Podarcis lilfordi]
MHAQKRSSGCRNLGIRLDLQNGSCPQPENEKIIIGESIQDEVVELGVKILCQAAQQRSQGFLEIYLYDYRTQVDWQLRALVNASYENVYQQKEQHISKV